MQISQPMNIKTAIIGMNAHFGTYSSLDAFERSIYEGQHLSDADNAELSSAVQQRFDRITKIALKDAAISNINIAMIVANNSKHELDGVIEVDSVFDALSIAQEQLNEVEAVVVGGVDLQGIGVVVLKRYEAAKRDRHKIYAVIDSLGAFAVEDIAYLELFGDKQLQETEIERVIPNYLATDSTRSRAVSSLANAGYKGIAGEIASFIKTALCLYYRYIPPVSQWQQQTPKDWQLYVASFAKPWFLEAGVKQRVAAINFTSNNAPIILSEELEPQKRSTAYLEQTPCYLFPLVAKDSQTLLEQLDSLKQNVASGEIAQTAKQTFIDYRDSQGDYALAIVGKNRSEILKECDRAVKGVTKAFETGKDWQTPVGSYFTATPQGKSKVAYVYPGAYNAHLGLGKDLFRLFPNLMDDPVIQSTCNRSAGIEKLLYPRSWHKLSPRELEAKERELMNDPLAMLESETGFAGFMTTILRDYFKVKPEAAFGYSLGETSMMYAQGVWDDIEQSSDLINASTLFKTRLAGTKEAVREYWQLSDEHQGELWRTYVVMANSEAVREKLKVESRVYLTQISTPKEVVIAGDPQGCERVIASLGCDAFRAPFNHVIHCEAMESEYDELIKLNTLPLRKKPEITFYSAADYQTIEHSSQDIAHSVTQTLCQQLDFPRLVERVYQDDYRIFIEVGVGSNCSRWIKDILKSKEHAVVSIHRRGTNDFTSLIKAIAKLFSHRVELDLSLLYGVEDSTSDESVVNAVKNSTLDPWQEDVHKSVRVEPIHVNDIANKAYSSQSETEKLSPVFNQTISNQLNSKTGLKNHDNNLILWQPNYLKSAKDGSIDNNSQISKAQSIFIERDREYCYHSKAAVSVHLKVLEKIINRPIKSNK